MDIPNLRTVSTFIPQQRFTEHRSLRKEEKIEQETKKEMRQRQNEKRLQRELIQRSPEQIKHMILRSGRILHRKIKRASIKAIEK